MMQQSPLKFMCLSPPRGSMKDALVLSYNNVTPSALTVTHFPEDSPLCVGMRLGERGCHAPLSAVLFGGRQTACPPDYKVSHRGGQAGGVSRHHTEFTLRGDDRPWSSKERITARQTSLGSADSWPSASAALFCTS